MIDDESKTPSGRATVQLIAETARVDKENVERGRVRVSTHTTTIDEIVRENLKSEAVEVTRIPVGRDLAGADVPGIRTEGDLTIVPVIEEVLVVEKRLVLVEELHIRRHQSVESVEVPLTLRKQHATVERIGPNDGPNQEKPA